MRLYEVNSKKLLEGLQELYTPAKQPLPYQQPPTRQNRSASVGKTGIDSIVRACEQ